MPTERMEEVEVVCDKCHGEGRQRLWSPMSGGPVTINCQLCSGLMKVTRLAPSGSLTAARLRLADAAEKWLLSKMGTFLTNQDGWDHHGRPWSPPTQGLSSAYAELAVLRGPMGATNDD